MNRLSVAARNTRTELRCVLDANATLSLRLRFAVALYQALLASVLDTPQPYISIRVNESLVRCVGVLKECSVPLVARAYVCA